MLNGGQLFTETLGQNNAGNITIDAPEHGSGFVNADAAVRRALAIARGAA